MREGKRDELGVPTFGEKGRRLGDLARAFWKKVRVTDGDGCWLWTGSTIHAGETSRGGYGATGVVGLPPQAHRAAWMLTHGDAGDLFVCHVCDVKLCVRPGHLHLGTHQDNMREAKERGLFVGGHRSLPPDFEGIDDYEPANTGPWLRGYVTCTECCGTGVGGQGERFDVYGLCSVCHGTGAYEPGRNHPLHHAARWPAAFARKRGATT